MNRPYWNLTNKKNMQHRDANIWEDVKSLPLERLSPLIVIIDTIMPNVVAYPTNWLIGNLIDSSPHNLMTPKLTLNE